MRGVVHLTLGDAQRELFQRYDQGAEVALRFVGMEKVYWAAGQVHDPKATWATKHLVNDDARREHSRNLINKELSLKKFHTSELL